MRDLIIENQRRGRHAEGGLRLYHFDKFPYTPIYAQGPTEGEKVRSKGAPVRLQHLQQTAKAKTGMFRMLMYPTQACLLA